MTPLRFMVFSCLRSSLTRFVVYVRSCDVGMRMTKAQITRVGCKSIRACRQRNKSAQRVTQSLTIGFPYIIIRSIVKSHRHPPSRTSWLEQQHEHTMMRTLGRTCFSHTSPPFALMQFIGLAHLCCRDCSTFFVYACSC